MKTNDKKHGFTIVELLTVMAVIAILIGLLVPAIDKVRKGAKDVKQKAQFHSIEVALEIFKNDEGYYPQSSLLRPDSTISPPFTCGAHKLAEALVGRDLLGFDPKTQWDAEEDETNTEAYACDDKSSTPDEKEESLERRKGPYLQLQNIGAFNIAQLFDDTKEVYPGDRDNKGNTTSSDAAPVLTDVYYEKRVTLKRQSSGSTITLNVMAGTPILYYKANTSSTVFNYQQPDLSIYDNSHNDPIIDLGQLKDPDIDHPFKADGSYQSKDFFEAITNPNITSRERPYNSDSFILLSAGNDGLYGTSDDIWNFGD